MEIIASQTSPETTVPLHSQVSVDFREWARDNNHLLDTEELHQQGLRTRVENWDNCRPYSPGRLYIDTHGVLQPVYPNSSDDEKTSPIVDLMEEIQTTPTPSNVDLRKKTLRFLKQAIVDHINDYSTERYTSGQKIINGSHLGSASTIETFTSRHPIHWRDKLVYGRRQSIHPSLYEAWPEGRKGKYQRPTIADKYIHKTLSGIDSESKDRLLELIHSDNGYIHIARLFYAGDMYKAFKNASAAGLDTKRAEWQAFLGTVSEYLEIKEAVQAIQPGMDGYIEFAEKFYAGDMHKAFVNASAAGLDTKKAKWQQFHGTVSECFEIKEALQAIQPGMDGYIEFAEKFYAGDMTKAFQNASAAGLDTKRAKWQVFLGTVSEYLEIKEALQAIQLGMDGYIEFAEKFYAGDMTKAFVNASAAGLDTKRAKWQVFLGTVSEYLEIKEALQDIQLGMDGYIEFAEK